MARAAHMAGRECRCTASRADRQGELELVWRAARRRARRRDALGGRADRVRRGDVGGELPRAQVAQSSRAVNPQVHGVFRLVGRGQIRQTPAISPPAPTRQRAHGGPHRGHHPARQPRPPHHHLERLPVPARGAPDASVADPDLLPDHPPGERPRVLRSYTTIDTDAYRPKQAPQPPSSPSSSPLACSSSARHTLPRNPFPSPSNKRSSRT